MLFMYFCHICYMQHSCSDASDLELKNEIEIEIELEIEFRIEIETE